MIETIDYALQRIFARVKVVRVKLYGKSSAQVIVDCHVPATTDAEVVTLRYYMYETLLAVFLLLLYDVTQYLGGIVCRVIVNDYYVVFELRYLTQCALYGVSNCLLTIIYRNDDRCLNRERLFKEVWSKSYARVNLRTNCLKVLCGSLLHFYLYAAVAWIHIVKLLFSALSVVEFFFRIEIFLYMEQCACALYVKAHGI